MLGSPSQLSLLSCNVFLTVCVFHFEKFVQRKTVQYTLESALHAATRYSPHATLQFTPANYWNYPAPSLVSGRQFLLRRGITVQSSVPSCCLSQYKVNKYLTQTVWGSVDYYEGSCAVCEVCCEGNTPVTAWQWGRKKAVPLPRPRAGCSLAQSPSADRKSKKISKIVLQFSVW